MAEATDVQTSAKPEAVLSPYERCAFVCAVLGVAALVCSAWLIWAPLAPAVAGTALLYAAWLSAKCARAEASTPLAIQKASRRAA